MNRLKNYLESRKIAEAYLDTAMNRAAKQDYGVAIAAAVKSVRYLIVANNNLQSLAFNQKPRRKHHVKKRSDAGGHSESATTGPKGTGSI